MTELECRIKYKMDTGERPTYGKYSNISGGNQACNYEGGLLPEYAMWLEKQLDDLWLEEKYQNDTSFQATYLKDFTIKVYTKGYKEWLEKRVCQI